MLICPWIRKDVLFRTLPKFSPSVIQHQLPLLAYRLACVTHTTLSKFLHLANEEDMYDHNLQVRKNNLKNAWNRLGPLSRQKPKIAA